VRQYALTSYKKGILMEEQLDILRRLLQARDTAGLKLVAPRLLLAVLWRELTVDEKQDLIRCGIVRTVIPKSPATGCETWRGVWNPGQGASYPRYTLKLELPHPAPEYTLRGRAFVGIDPDDQWVCLHDGSATYGRPRITSDRKIQQYDGVTYPIPCWITPEGWTTLDCEQTDRLLADTVRQIDFGAEPQPGGQRVNQLDVERVVVSHDDTHFFLIYLCSGGSVPYYRNNTLRYRDMTYGYYCRPVPHRYRSQEELPPPFVAATWEQREEAVARYVQYASLAEAQHGVWRRILAGREEELQQQLDRYRIRVQEEQPGQIVLQSAELAERLLPETLLSLLPFERQSVAALAERLSQLVGTVRRGSLVFYRDGGVRCDHYPDADDYEAYPGWVFYPRQPEIRGLVMAIAQGQQELLGVLYDAAQDVLQSGQHRDYNLETVASALANLLAVEKV